MDILSLRDGTELFFKDWGSGQPIVFHYGWPLSADDWDAQMLFFREKGFRVIAHDRRGHGRSTQTDSGNDMDTYAADVAELAAALDLHEAIHVGDSTGGGEVARYVARHGKGRVAKAVLVSAVPPIMLKTESNPGGLPLTVFDGLRAALAANRAQFYRDLPSGPFYGFNRPDAELMSGVVDNWWRQGMMGGERRRTTTVSRPSPRRISRQTSRRSTFRPWCCMAMTIRSSHTRIPPSCRSSYCGMAA